MKEFWKTHMAGLAVLLLAAILSGGLQAWRSDLNLRERLEISPVELLAGEQGVPVLRTDELRQVVEQGSHLLLDARSMAEYDAGHLPGAMPVPLAEFEEAFPAIAPMLTPTDPLVVYCSGPTCDDALLLAARLREAGFTDVSLYLDGWEGWSQ